MEEVAEENQLTEIEAVTLQLGEVSGVVESYLQNCWKWAVEKKSEILKDSALVVETIPAITFCEDCGKTYGTVEYGKICPYCGSQRTYLQQGNEFLIKEISGCCLRQGQSVLPEWSAPPPVSAFRLFQEWFKHSVEQRRIYQGGQGKAKEKPAAGIQRHEL